MEERGHERVAAAGIIRSISDVVDERAAPDLLLGDGLYLTASIFRCVRTAPKRHILVKYPASGREKRLMLFSTALLRFSSPLYRDAVTQVSGFDNKRLCEYSLRATVDEFAGYPVRVIHVSERYVKRSVRSAKSSFWIVTTDMNLSAEAAREAAHLRWSIENEGFKTLSHLAGTKRMVSHDPITATHFLQCVTAAVVLLTLIRIHLEGAKNQIPPVYRNARMTGKGWAALILEALWGMPVFR